jgi:hypothetical protein
MRKLGMLIIIAAIPQVATGQTSAAQLVGRTCIGSYDTGGFRGTLLVRFLDGDQSSAVTVERYRITETNRAKLAQTHGGTYEVSLPDQINLSDFESLGRWPAKIDPSKAGPNEFPIVGNNAPNEWSGRMVDDKLNTRSVQWDRFDPKLNGVIGIVAPNTYTCTQLNP